MRKERKSFQYEKRSKDDVKKRASQSGGLFDSIVKQSFTSFTPKEGDYRLRFLPPTWENPEHFGFDIFVHYGIGSDNQSYLCLEKMKGEKCPICEERKRAEKAGDADYARTLTPTKRVLTFIVDRDNEDDGPQLWSMAWTIDRDLANLSIDKRSGEYMALDDPEDGYDVEFTRTGKGLKTKYVGIQVARKATALSDDPDQAEAWLKFVSENPLPEVLQYYDYDHIAAAAQGKAKEEDDDDDEEEDRPTRSSKSSKVASRRKQDDDEDDDEEEKFDCIACSDTGRNSKGGFCVCAKGKKLKAKKSIPDDDEEDEEDDDEEEKRPTRKAAESAKKKPVGKTVRTSPSDDEDDEDDEEEEKIPPKRVSTKKSKPVDDDDDEDDDDD